MAKSRCSISRDFTKKTFPGVYHMDLFSGLFGDMADDSMYVKSTVNVDGASHTMTEFDPSSASGKKWLEKMANKHGRHRDEVSSHLKQCSARHLRSRCQKNARPASR